MKSENAWLCIDIDREVQNIDIFIGTVQWFIWLKQTVNIWQQETESWKSMRFWSLMWLGTNYAFGNSFTGVMSQYLLNIKLNWECCWGEDVGCCYSNWYCTCSAQKVWCSHEQGSGHLVCCCCLLSASSLQHCRARIHAALQHFISQADLLLGQSQSANSDLLNIHWQYISMLKNCHLAPYFVSQIHTFETPIKHARLME